METSSWEQNHPQPPPLPPPKRWSSGGLWLPWWVGGGSQPIGATNTERGRCLPESTQGYQKSTLLPPSCRRNPPPLPALSSKFATKHHRITKFSHPFPSLLLSDATSRVSTLNLSRNRSPRLLPFFPSTPTTTTPPPAFDYSAFPSSPPSSG